MQTIKGSSSTAATFVVAVNNREIFENNFLASPCIHAPHGHQLLVQEGFTSAPKAYNDAIEKSSNELIVFCHQDLFLPEKWLSDVWQGIDYLDLNDPSWGVLGCSGITRDGRRYRHVYSSGLGITGEPFGHPVPIQTLDEIVLILRKSSGLRFDESLPHFHLYGSDICLRALRMGMKSYAVSAFCVHNTHQNLILAKEFYECCMHVKRVWPGYLPIQTTCIRITRFNLPIYMRRLRETYLRHIRRKEFGGTRARNSDSLKEIAEAVGKS